MTDRTQPDSASTTGSTHIIRYALKLGLLWVDGDGRDKVREALDALDTLEAQLEAIGAGGVSGPLMGRTSLQSPGFDAADMATASAQGFRGGVASLAASVDSELVYQARYQKGFWQDSSRERNEYLQNPENTCAEDWETRILYTRPPTAQAEGWRPIETAPKGERVLLWSEITRGEPFIGDWAEYARYNHPQFTHWSRWDGLPPTSAEGVEHG